MNREERLNVLYKYDCGLIYLKSIPYPQNFIDKYDNFVTMKRIDSNLWKETPGHTF